MDRNHDPACPPNTEEPDDIAGMAADRNQNRFARGEVPEFRASRESAARDGKVVKTQRFFDVNQSNAIGEPLAGVNQMPTKVG